MATPNWSGASVGQPPLAAQVNQFLGTHAATIVYTGSSALSQTTAGSGGTNTNSLYIAQSFTTSGAITTSRVALNLSVTGTPLAATVSVQANSGSAPSGTPLASIALPAAFVTGSSTAISMPFAVSLAASTTYWMVINAVGDVSDLYTWFKSNQVSGASTSTNGSTWTAQAYGLIYNVFTATYTGYPVHTYEDAGARWTTLTASSSDLTNLAEYTVSQATNDYVSSSRSFSYTGGMLTSIS